MAERKGAVPGPSGPMGRATITTPDKNCSPAQSRSMSLKALTESNIEHLYEKYLHGAAQKHHVAPEELSPTLQHTLRVAAKKEASKRVTLIREGAKQRKLRPLRPKLDTPTKAKGKSPSKQALLGRAPDMTLPPNDSHNLESSTPSDHHTKPQTSFGMAALPTLYGHELGSDELEQLRSYPSGGVPHPQLLNDVIVPEGDPFMNNHIGSQGGRGSLFEPARMNHHMASSPPSGSFQIQNMAVPSPGNHFARNSQIRNHFNQPPAAQRPITQTGKMISPQSLVFPATADDGNRNQDVMIPSTPRYHVHEPVDQASDMISPQSQFIQATSGHGNQGQEFIARPPSRLTLDPARIDPRVYDHTITDNPFEIDGPAKSLADVIRRARYHTAKLNLLHETRKQDNVRISYNYIMQGNWLSDALGDYLAMVTGLRTTSELLVAYGNDPHPQKFMHLVRWVQAALIPKLQNMGPELKGVLANATRVINDPEYRQSCTVHVSHAFYLSFCGIKASLLIMDRHREDHPEEWPAGLGNFKFEDIFPVTRQMVWTWLMPDDDDHILGEHDHYFVLQGPPADPEDILAPLTTAADENMT